MLHYRTDMRFNQAVGSQVTLLLRAAADLVGSALLNQTPLLLQFGGHCPNSRLLCLDWFRILCCLLLCSCLALLAQSAAPLDLNRQKQIRTLRHINTVIVRWCPRLRF